MAHLLMVQVLTLAHQLDPNILRRGVSAGLWDDLRHLLDMLPHAEGEGDPRLGMITTQRGPSILATDAAVTAVEVNSCSPSALPPQSLLLPSPPNNIPLPLPIVPGCDSTNGSALCSSFPPLYPGSSQGKAWGDQ